MLQIILYWLYLRNRYRRKRSSNRRPTSRHRSPMIDRNRKSIKRSWRIRSRRICKRIPKMRSKIERRTFMIPVETFSNAMKTTAGTSSISSGCRRTANISSEPATIRCTCTMRGTSNSARQFSITVNSNSTPYRRGDPNGRSSHHAASPRTSPGVLDVALSAACTCWRNRANKGSRSRRTSRLDTVPT